jgi:hypothetical protein
VIDSVFSFDDIHAAFTRLQAPDLFGNVVVDIAPGAEKGSERDAHSG